MTTQPNPVPGNCLIVEGVVTELNFTSTETHGTPFGSVTVAVGVDGFYDPHLNPPTNSFQEAATLLENVLNQCRGQIDGETANQCDSAVTFLKNAAEYQQRRVNAIFELMQTLQSYDTPM